MARSVFGLVLAMLLSSTAVAQGPPKADDTSAYSEAYTLLFDTRARALKAVSVLLPEGKAPKDLSNRQLSLLCRAYNELGKSKTQLSTAELMWQREPGSVAATRWMVNSLLNVYAYSDNAKPLFDFVEKALTEKHGSRRELLVLKATAIIAQKKGLKDGEKRAVVSDLLVDAYKSGPPLSDLDQDDLFATQDTPDFIDFDPPFPSFFSGPERETLKARMTKARAEETAKQDQIKP